MKLSEDERLVKLLYEDGAIIIADIEKDSNRVLNSAVKPSFAKAMVISKKITGNLIRLDVISKADFKDMGSFIRGYYRLSKRIKVMIDTAIRYRKLRLEENYNHLEFLDLAKIATLIERVSTRMVDFTYNGIKYTANKELSYEFFKSQHLTSIKIREEGKRNNET